MLFTSSNSVFNKMEQRFKPYYLIRNQGNDVVLPDQSDLEQYRNGSLTWSGFKVNYLAKLMRPEADEWMRRVSGEAVDQEVVLVSEENGEHYYRIFLAEMILNMFSGRIDIRYGGELEI